MEWVHFEWRAVIPSEMLTSMVDLALICIQCNPYHPAIRMRHSPDGGLTRRYTQTVLGNDGHDKSSRYDIAVKKNQSEQMMASANLEKTDWDKATTTV